MKSKYVFVLAIVVLILAASSTQAQWRSSLYPVDWSPGYKDTQGRFIHDFSYAGYHKGESEIPVDPPGATVDVIQAPYYADNTGAADCRYAIWLAIYTVGTAGGGIVYLPAGTYRICNPLNIEYSGVVLRGAGAGKTFLFNDKTLMRTTAVILVKPGLGAWGGWHDPLPGTEVGITEDVSYPTHEIPVAQTAGFNVGDWVVLRTDCTEDFITEHGMTGQWDASLEGITFYRIITAVDPNSNTITVDIPTRYYLKRRDNARVYKVAPHLEEVGIEHLSIGMRENLKPGLGENDYNVAGTAAWDLHWSHCIRFEHVVNGWIQGVQTYRPPVNTNDWHVLSNVIALRGCRNVTIRNCIVGKPEYEGAGGNGYGYSLSGNDCLVIGCTAFHTRHNYSFHSMWTSGNVVFRCESQDGYLPSDFHMHLSPANLVDNMFVDGDYLDAVYRPCCTHGHSTTESVFWNSYGTDRCPGKLIVSRQWKWGYVIGTSGPVYNVERGTQDNTAPEDFLEGEGQGQTLVPQSLYLDQFYRRRGSDLNFDGEVDFVDFSVFGNGWLNDCNSPDWCYGLDFDRDGAVDFRDLGGLVADWLVQK